MALQPRSRTHPAYAQIRGHPVSSSKKGHLVLSNIHSNHKKYNEEKPMGAVSAFTTWNYHCNPPMTDVIVIHMTDVTVIRQVNMSNKGNKKWHLAKV